MPLQLKSWDMIANGKKMTFTPSSIDSKGKLKGKIVDGAKTQTIEGFWNEEARQISFLRIIDPDKPSATQIFTGYLAGDNHLAGTFEAFAGSGGTAQRSVFGWAASIPQPV